MDELSHRILRLERARKIVSGGHASSALLDRGPYNADDLIEGWSVDATFDAGDEVFTGREEIHRFFTDLAATYTIHYSTNTIVEFDESLESANILAYGFEAPVISGRALVGAFGHEGCTRLKAGRWEATERKQTIHFLCPVTTGWIEPNRITEQRRSKGA